MSPLTIASLEQTAQRAAQNAYAPYSKFPVGAAVLAKDGTQYSGCNVENASFGLTNCAERTAVFKAVAAGHREITCVAIHTPTPEPTAPCGACRQVLREFGPNMKVISICDGDGRIETTLGQLLPNSFGPENL
jgi:cytidine deaminase